MEGGAGHAAQPVRPLTRAVAGVLVGVLVLAAVGLYGWPGATDRHFAWTIQPELTPLAMGAGYASGIVFFAFVARGARWLEVSFGFVGITAFATLMAVATVLHWDRFDHDHPTFWAWVAIYAVAPVLVPALWLHNSAWRPGPVEPGDAEVPSWARLLLGLAGAALFLVGLVVFVRPQLAVEHWPWEVTPLTARVLGSFTALSVGWAVAAALERRASAYRIPLLSSLAGLVLLLGALARGRDDLRDGAVAGLYVAVAVALTLLLGLVFAVLGRARRARS